MKKTQYFFKKHLTMLLQHGIYLLMISKSIGSRVSFFLNFGNPLSNGFYFAFICTRVEIFENVLRNNFQIVFIGQKSDHVLNNILFKLVFVLDFLVAKFLFLLFTFVVVILFSRFAFTASGYHFRSAVSAE